ncbi:MAG: hypothetical protein GY863_20125, partial [bacterium]|nr:hypothetical protein [bacterium]
KNILEKQTYPDLRKYGHLWQGISRTLKWDGTPLAPYDGVGWTLSEQMGIITHRMSTPLQHDISSLIDAEYPEGKISGSGRQYIFSSAENNSYKAVNLIFKDGGGISRTQSAAEIGGVNYPAGSFIVNTQRISRNKLAEIAQETNITMTGAGSSGETISLTQPRIGLYKSWSASMDEGWITYVFDTYAFEYTELTDAEIKAGDLINRYDVIILPDQRASSIINGHRKGTMPPDYTGGITNDGVENLKTFVSEGGSLVCNKASCDLAIDEFKLPVKNVLRSVPSDSFNCPGSILKVNYNTDYSLTFGMTENGIGYISRAAAFEVKQKSEKNNGPETVIIAEYPDENLLISGWILGENRIQGKAAIIEAPYKKGKIVLFGFNVHNRAQSYTNFKLLFNAVFGKQSRH